MTNWEERAESLDKKTRKKIISHFSEVGELIPMLQELFSQMERSYIVEITHGMNEYGKDLVIVKKDSFGVQAIGVVVKSGKFSGKSSGDVDDLKDDLKNIINEKDGSQFKMLKSQVEQARSSKADLKGVWNTLPISEVYVVVAGEFSKNAKDRLRVELDGLDKYLKLYDINWLVDQFTQHHPRIFFNHEIDDLITREIENIERTNLKSPYGNDEDLKTHFVSPILSATSMPSIKDEEDIIKLAKNDFFKKKKLSFAKFSEMSGSGKYILVGEPGSGKSTAINKIAFDELKITLSSISKDCSKNILIPLRVHSRDILSSKTIMDLIRTRLGDDAIVKDKIKITRLMVDALDEVEVEHRPEVILRASKFSDELGAGLIITSRKISFLESAPANFEKYEILPFEYAQAVKLIKNLMSRDSSKMEVLERNISEINIPMFPLALTLLVRLVKEFKEVPSTLTELYTRYFEFAFGKFDENKGVKVLFDHHMKRKFLSKLAFEEFLSKDKLSINKTDFNRYITQYYNDYSCDGDWDIQEFVGEIERCGAIKISDKVDFSHRSFLEYFAAYYIYEKQDDLPSIVGQDFTDFVSRIYMSEVWGETTFFYFGLKKEVSQKITNKILITNECDGMYECVGKLTFPRMYQAGINTENKIKSEGILKAIKYAKIIRDKFKEISNSGVTYKVSDMFPDIWLLNLSVYSLSSVFLTKEVKNVISLMNTQDDCNMPYYMTLALAGIEQKIDNQEVAEIIQKIVNKMKSLESYSKNEEARITLFLKKIEDGSGMRQEYRIATKKLNKMMRRNKELFKGIHISKGSKKLKKVSSGK